jgi:hypothetical protein
MKKLCIYVFIAITGFLACDNKVGTTPPSISILSPVESELFNIGDSVHIHFMVTHEDDLHHVEMALINTSLDAAVWDTLIHHHSQEFMFDEKWYADVADHTDMRLRVEAFDHNDNMALDSVSFHIMP